VNPKTERLNRVDAAIEEDGKVTAGKTPFAGLLVSIQPRMRLTRSFDQRSHTYQGWIFA
jgi:hypothetical protein